MPKLSIIQYQKIDKNDQIDLTNLAIHQFSLVHSNGGSWKNMAKETTQSSVFDSTPDSQMYEYKLSVEKVQTELLQYGLTSTMEWGWKANLNCILKQWMN